MPRFNTRTVSPESLLKVQNFFFDHSVWCQMIQEIKDRNVVYGLMDTTAKRPRKNSSTPDKYI